MLNIKTIFKNYSSNMSTNEFFTQISENYCVDETEYINQLINFIDLQERQLQQVTQSATELVNSIRDNLQVEDTLDALLREYDLSTQEGVVLMCLAEALLRIPDKATADALIRDKLSGVDWKSHLGNSDNRFVNFATWGLVLTGKLIISDENPSITIGKTLKRMSQKLTEPVVRAVIGQAMAIMGKQFVLGRTITEAIKNGKKQRQKGYSYSYDMLGEAALTQTDAVKYFNDYNKALQEVGDSQATEKSLKPSLSIKLSALHPRYEVAKTDRVLNELFDTVKKLALSAKSSNTDITIDAEEADRLELSLILFEKLIRDPELAGWKGLGIVVQAYSKRCLPVLMWLTLLGKELATEIPVRLVKGAYWDSEIKQSQQQGLSGYPVFTRKEATDISYLACAKFLLSQETEGVIYPQFATHNAHTAVSILQIADGRRFEFQQLHGMGEALYSKIIEQTGIPVRIYAPVGVHKDLLPYLVRRLLENGANSSFVYQLVDLTKSVDALTEHPVELMKRHSSYVNPKILLPADLYGDIRKNSLGLNMNIASVWHPFYTQYQRALNRRDWSAKPLIDGKVEECGEKKKSYAPYDPSIQIGEYCLATQQNVQKALESLDKAWFDWNQLPVEKRAVIFERLAQLLEQNREELMALCTLEAGKTLQDGIDEVREAIDFCYYYAQQAKILGQVLELKGPTGESNRYSLSGKGIFVCISPWNFPLAIFLGQIVAALVSGNVVLAKPSEQTTLTAYRAVELLFEAGLPKNVLAFLPGSGKELGEIFNRAINVAGICFTGSTQTAQMVNRDLASREGAIAVLIAETGGQNAMLVDSSALPEQVVKDVMTSAFISAGQRCSALRVLYLQEEVADRIIQLLKGALAELKVGMPSLHEVDVGPVIDKKAQIELMAYITEQQNANKCVAVAKIDETSNGYFVAPTILEIKSILELDAEHFGPILHIVRYSSQNLDAVINDINQTGYGLTLGVHSRNETTIEKIQLLARVGNVYINRNQVGAVVGVQPFGGRGLSGTGPKAGGPNYLIRFMDERSVSTNTTAIGGNAELLSLSHG